MKEEEIRLRVDTLRYNIRSMDAGRLKTYAEAKLEAYLAVLGERE